MDQTLANNVSAKLTFIVPSAQKPVFESAAYTGGAPRIFFETEQHTVSIGDMRQLAVAPALDREGFEFRNHSSKVDDFYDDGVIERIYYPEIETLLRSALGASQVVVFDTTRRVDDGTNEVNPDGTRRPASRVHVDYTVKSGPQRTRDVFGEAKAEELFKRGARVVQINVWRPIQGPVQRSPLAIADAGSVRAEELVATEQVFPGRVGEIYHLAYHPQQRWYFAPRMTSDEVLLIKGWDSLNDGRARFTPHGAFDLPNTPANAPARASIEVRTLAVIEA